ncbi:ArnT family glycosyltransferase [Candidatus Sumerlaeota bacterium]
MKRCLSHVFREPGVLRARQEPARHSSCGGVLELFILIGVYLVSRIIVLALGVRFDASSLDSFWQYLDLSILQNGLLQGVYYQHSQPPLFNIFLGVVLKLFPASYVYVFAALYYLCGLLIYFLIYQLLCLAKFNSRLALALATIFIVAPGAILYEQWLFYTWPVAALLTFAAYAFFLYEKTQLLRYAVCFLIAISIVCLTRSAFHLVYLAACIALILLVRSPRRKMTGAFAVGALLLVGSLFLKNLVVFGFFGSSSWMGMSVWNIVKENEAPILTADPAVIMVEPFSSIDQYPEKYRDVPDKFSAIPGLTDEYKQSGAINLNHYGYLAISAEYLKGARDSISYDVAGYLKNVVWAWGFYAKPSWDYCYMEDNGDKIRGYLAFISLGNAGPYFDRQVLGIRHDLDYSILSLLIIPTALLLVIIHLALCFTTITRVRVSCEARLCLCFIVFTILYVTVLGNSIELRENNRFRVQIDPLLYIATVISLRGLGRKFYAKGAE